MKALIELKKVFVLLACLAILVSCETAKSTDTKASVETASVTPANPQSKSPTSEIDASTSSSGTLATYTLDESSLITALDEISANLEAKKLAYVSSLKQDCSGIFHQLVDSIQQRIPTLADQAKFSHPSFSAERSSRQIADWYHRNNNLLIVQDPMAERNKIRPGSVMFYGRNNEKYDNVDIDLLVNPGKFVHDGKLGKIMHIAVVTSVEKDDAGNVIKYTIMHGRNEKHSASRTTGNYDGPGGFAETFADFPFGNWKQQWVAMAHLETPTE